MISIMKLSSAAVVSSFLPVERASTASTSTSNVRLDEGENSILAKILNRPHAFNCSLRIVSEDGQPHNAVVWD